ncbi:MAG: hypothetical protein JWQ02_187 [Capsulimonas sp.]|jgi:hypothetical protein|nr:hypothetical protein [Capsulimonas sp.]
MLCKLYAWRLKSRLEVHDVHLRGPQKINAAATFLECPEGHIVHF